MKPKYNSNPPKTLAEARAIIAESLKDLAECYRLTGADPDGDEDWRLAGEAVRAVKELREELDRREDQAYHDGIERDLID